MFFHGIFGIHGKRSYFCFWPTSSDIVYDDVHDRVVAQIAPAGMM
jgi:hypothetical protein